MYFILTGGKHPLYIDNEDNVETYIKKMSGLEQLDVPKDFSWLAKNLFTRLTKIQSSQRYTAKGALQHPWITRKNEGGIPMNLLEQVNYYEAE